MSRAMILDVLHGRMVSYEGHTLVSYKCGPSDSWAVVCVVRHTDGVCFGDPSWRHIRAEVAA